MSFHYADWPLPAGVHCGWSTRQSGFSRGVYSANNLARHVGGDPSVEQNRLLLQSRMTGLPTVHWLNQTHSTIVADLQGIDPAQGQDGATTTQSGQACSVMTADCLPVFLWTASGDRIAAVHAGWRGLANGILLNALAWFGVTSRVYAGIGPAISQPHFEVGQDVINAFAGWADADRCFSVGHRDGKYQCDLSGLARAQLLQAGLARVYLSHQCTFADPGQFYSYRRDGETGRMANLIWKTN